MKTTRILGALVLASIVAVTGCDDAETAGGNEVEVGDTAAQPMAPGQGMDPAMMAQVREMQQIQQQLQPIQQQALQDEDLAEQLTSIQADIESAMREENPEALDRMESLQQEMMEAQTAGDQERIQELMGEAQALQPQIQALQTAVFERPEIQERVETFEAAHRERMIEIDPEAEALLDRMDEIMASMPRMSQ